jgi:hypothetical protein
LLHRELPLLHGAVHVFGAEADRFLGFEALGFDFEAAGLDDLGGLGLFVGAHLGHGAGLLRGVLFVAALLLALGDVGVGVFLFDLHLRALGEFVGEDFFALGDLGDFFDALGVEDVVGIVLLEGRLFEVIDGDVLEEETVEVLADGVLDLVAELGALGEELVELHLFAGGFEGLGEFRFEELAELIDVGDALGGEHLGDLAHAVGRGFDADVEGHGDVGADVVAADEAVFAFAGDLQFFHGDIDDVVALHDRQSHHPIEGDFDAAPAGFYAGAAGLDHADAEDRDDADEENEGGEGNKQGSGKHGEEGLRLEPRAWRTRRRTS